VSRARLFLFPLKGDHFFTGIPVTGEEDKFKLLNKMDNTKKKAWWLKGWEK